MLILVLVPTGALPARRSHQHDPIRRAAIRKGLRQLPETDGGRRH